MNYSFQTPVADLSVSSLSFTVKTPRTCESHDGSSHLSGGKTDLTSNKTSSPERQRPLSHSETRLQTPAPTNPNSETSVYADQDQPLSFDHTRLAVAAAAFRGPSVQRGPSQTQSLARVLQAGLPNIVNASLRQKFPTQNNNGTTVGQKTVVRKSDCEAAEMIPGKSSNTGTTEERTGHLLRLDCYSSSDEECDT